VACLKESDTRMAVVTSKARHMTLRTLACWGMEDAFEVLVTVDDVGKGKPDPEPVNPAAALWGPFTPARLEEVEPHFYLESPRYWIWGRRWLSVPRWRSRSALPSRGLSG
jgi:pyrophosphatase PpaX